MKILHLLNDTGYGGVQEAALNIIWFTQHKPYLYRIKSGALEPYFAERATILGGPDFETYIVQYVKENKIDLIHAHCPGGSWPTYMKQAAECCPTVEQVHCVRTTCQQEVKGTRRRVVGSQYNYGLQPNKHSVDIIPYPISSWMYQPTKKKKQYKMHIGRLGNITGVKCPTDFIQAARQLKDIYGSQVHFTLAGNSTQQPAHVEDCRRLIRKLDMEAYISLELNVQDKFDLLQQFDIFLYPTMKESYCLSFVEAMFCGLPVVTYDDSANKETVSRGGLTVRPGNIKSLVQATCSLINDPKLRANLGDLGRQIARTRNNPRQVASSWDTLYDVVKWE